MWRKCVESHRAYAAENGYDYKLVGSGKQTYLRMESAWLKIPLIIGALDAGHEWVMYLDSDAEFAKDAPRFESVEEVGKDVYLANGMSRRPNSGVIIVKNSPSSRALFSRILLCAGLRLPKEHAVGWGENGEVIHFLSAYPRYTRMSRRWNNNQQPELVDYVRHYSAGPMRRLYEFDEAPEEAIGKMKIVKTADNKAGSKSFFEGILGLLEDEKSNKSFNLKPVMKEISALISEA